MVEDENEQLELVAVMTLVHVEGVGEVMDIVTYQVTIGKEASPSLPPACIFETLRVFFSHKNSGFNFQRHYSFPGKRDE